MPPQPQPVAIYGANTLRTINGTAVAGAVPQQLVGYEERRRAIVIDNEGTGDLFISEEDPGVGLKLLNGGGVRIAAGTSREFRTTAPLRVFAPGGGPLGVYAAQIEVD